MVFPIPLYRCTNWTIKLMGKLLTYLKCGVRDSINRKMNKWILDQMNPELSLEAEMTKVRLLYFTPIMRNQYPQEMTIKARKS